MGAIIDVNTHTISSEHICCKISDKKCVQSYQAKKDWLKREFNKGYVFRRLDERAKVFIEYGPAENACAILASKGGGTLVYEKLGNRIPKGQYSGQYHCARNYPYPAEHQKLRRKPQ